MENKYFESALSGFVFDIAGGNTIRHFADKGYSVKQIKESIEYPVSFDKVQKTVWEHLLSKKVILMEEPGAKIPEDKIVYVEKYGKYGRKSFCGKAVTEKDYSRVSWKITEYKPVNKQSFSGYISEKYYQNGENPAYISCDFGRIKRQDHDKFEIMMELLDSRQKEYIEGLPFPCMRVYHQLDLRMQEIAGLLYEKGLYTGCCYFMGLEEKINIAG